MAMMGLLKFGLLALCATGATLVLLSTALLGLLRIAPDEIYRTLSASPDLLLFPVLMWIEFCCLTNDLLAYVADRYGVDFGIKFTDIRFTADLDNRDTPISLTAKLSRMYPLSLALLLAGYVLALNGRP